MPCIHEFGILKNLDKNKDYGYYHPKEYNCVAIHDDAIYGWVERLKEMKSYFHRFSRSEYGIAWYGVTLIPPESLNLFYDIVANNTDAEFAEQVPPLLEVIAEAILSDSFLIHFGI